MVAHEYFVDAEQLMRTELVDCGGASDGEFHRLDVADHFPRPGTHTTSRPSPRFSEGQNPGVYLYAFDSRGCNRLRSHEQVQQRIQQAVVGKLHLQHRGFRVGQIGSEFN